LCSTIFLTTPFSAITRPYCSASSRLEGQHDDRRIVIPMQPLQHRAHGFGAHERHIAVENQHVTRKTGERGFGLLHGMAGAELRILHGEFRALHQRLGQLLASSAHDDDLARGLQRIGACKQVHQHGPPGDRMQHLVKVAFHAGTLAGSKDNECERRGRFSHARSLPAFACSFQNAPPRIGA
jgi:hypothetical protein